jgi:hypothetical protein
MRRPVAAQSPTDSCLMRLGKGPGGNREVPPVALRAGCAAFLEEEGGPWGKHGFPCGTEWPAWMPGAEDAA